jgi:hypothetical protein
VSSASFFDFLEQSLAVLRREMPVAHRAFVDVLAGRRLRIEADGEERVVSFDASGLGWHGERERVDLAVSFDQAAMLDLVDGRMSLPSAVVNGPIKLRGAIETIERFDCALRAYVQGAVRCPSMPGLFSGYRGMDE